ncbi:hypothetical protein ACHAXA_003863 [Cyclostephanos tholiformis]|uniref:Uncharacterized protein n=1 Tax=Cyclostephanos tholiformis TaxID=382380 RepID=A0ABD3RWV9_9STRA
MSIVNFAGRRAMSSIVPGVLVQFLPPMALFACWLLIYLLQDLCLALAYILRRFARHAEDVAVFLEAAKGRAMDGLTRPPGRRSLASEPISFTSHVREAGDGNNLLEDDVQDADDRNDLEDVETEMFENSKHEVSRLANGGRARSGAMKARPPPSVLTKREAGLERVRAFHEWRKRRGLKV